MSWVKKAEQAVTSPETEDKTWGEAWGDFGVPWVITPEGIIWKGEEDDIHAFTLMYNAAQLPADLIKAYDLPTTYNVRDFHQLVPYFSDYKLFNDLKSRGYAFIRLEPTRVNVEAGSLDYAEKALLSIPPSDLGSVKFLRVDYGPQDAFVTRIGEGEDAPEALKRWRREKALGFQTSVRRHGWIKGAKKEALSEKEIEQTLRAQDQIAKAVRRVEQQFAKEKLTKKAKWGESGFWLSPDGVLVNFPYPSVQHHEAIDEGLLQLSPQEQQELEESDSPVEDLVRRGWTRGIVDADEVYVQVSDESHVAPALARLPFLAPKLIVDADPSNNSDEGYFALLLGDGDTLESAWRERNRPRVFAKCLHRPRS